MTRTAVALGLLLLLAVMGPAHADTTADLGLKPEGDSHLLLGGMKMVGLGLLLTASTGAVLWGWRRRLGLTSASATNDDGAPAVLSSRRVSQKTVLFVVRWRGREYLLAESNGSLSPIDDVVPGDMKP